MSGLHPAFERARPERRWTGKLEGLRPVLAREADADRTRWHWRILPHGAVVAEHHVDGLVEVRISRKEAPPAGKEEKWDRELAIFERELGLSGWDREPDRDAEGVGMLYRCPEDLLCECGRRKSDNGMLFGDPNRCDHCQLEGARQ